MSDPVHVVCVSGLFVDAAGRLILVREEDRGWGLPGGRVEQGEGLVEAMLREAREETGCAVRVERLCAVETRVTAPHMVLFTFRGVHLVGEPGGGDEVAEAAWFTEAEVLARVTEPAAAARPRAALDSGPRPRLWVYRQRPFEVREERMV